MARYILGQYRHQAIVLVDHAPLRAGVAVLVVVVSEERQVGVDAVTSSAFAIRSVALVDQCVAIQTKRKCNHSQQVH
jgi:mRNA-degrading endonuclease toxin of MazEF toxin-antitoxin module